MKKCKYCSEEITAKRRTTFCSKECSDNFNNRMRRTPGSECIVCLAEVGRHSTKYCSVKCQKLYEKRKRYSEYEKTGVCTGTQSTIKKYVLYRDGHICSICERTSWAGLSIPLVLDHIDGHSDNNRLDNLRLVCGNCDMQLPTYKSKNRGNGRHSRRQRYKEGKSY